MPECDLAQTALVLRAKEPPTQWVISNNERFRVDTAQPPSSKNGFETSDGQFHFELHLRFDNLNDLKHGWTFGIGSDAVTPDIFLDDKKKPRHANKLLKPLHFAIQYNLKSGNLVLNNFSSEVIKLVHGRSKDIEVSSATGSETLDAEKVYELTVGPLKFLIEYPELTDTQRKTHHKNYIEFRKRSIDALPDLDDLILSPTASTRPKREPPCTRQGRKRYSVREQSLGEGGMGVVKLAYAPPNGDPVAIKELKGGFYTKRQEQRFWQEIDIMKQLDHKNVMRCLDVISDAKGPAIVMEYMRGKDLGKRHSDLYPPQRIGVIKQMFEGLAYIHGQNYIHRDIKPANILLAFHHRGHVTAKVADFGLAKIAAYLNTNCGTPRYQAPETIKPNYDQKADIWSAGITLLEVAGLLKDLEFDWKTWHAEVEKKVNDLHKENAYPFYELLRDMLRVNPEERPSAQQCLDRWVSWCKKEDEEIAKAAREKRIRTSPMQNTLLDQTQPSKKSNAEDNAQQVEEAIVQPDRSIGSSKKRAREADPDGWYEDHEEDAGHEGREANEAPEANGAPEANEAPEAKGAPKANEGCEGHKVAKVYKNGNRKRQKRGTTK